MPASLANAIDVELGQLLRSEAPAGVTLGVYESMAPDARAALSNTAASSSTALALSMVDPALAGPLPSVVLQRPDALVRDLRLLIGTFEKEALGGAAVGTIAIVAHPYAAGRAPTEALARDLGVASVVLVPATSGVSVQEAVASAAPALVYVDAGTGLAEAALRQLASDLAERNILAFAATPEQVRLGFLAAVSPGYEPALARRAALAIADLSRGEADEQAPLAAALPPARLTIHTGTAARLGIALPWDLLLQADLVGEPAQAASGLTLDQATRIAARDNIGVAVETYALEAAEASIGIARSGLLPQVTASSTARLINEDLAAAALGGAAPERLWTVEASVAQVLFSERAFAGVGIQKRLAAAQQYQLDEARLAAAAEGAHAFLGVLQAETGAAIAEERLARLAVDLDAAEARERAGTTSAADVARLRAESARARQDLARALGGVDAASFALNQALNLPIDAEVRPTIEGEMARASEPRQNELRPTDPVQSVMLLASAEPASAGALSSSLADEAFTGDALAAPRALLASIPVLPTVDSRAQTDLLADRYVEQALLGAPAARALASVIDAQERRLGAARRAPYLPEVSVFANASTRLADGGAGLALPPGLPIPAAPDETWVLGVRLDFGLFLGGRQRAERRLASAELSQAQARLTLIEQRLTQGVRTSAALLGTSYAAYNEAEDAADAAASAYADVARLYREGLVGVTALVEAQEALRLTQELAAAAAYEVAGAYVDLQRTSGSFDALDSLPASELALSAASVR
ncbi:MAG: TolC family protein [Bacteroidota bacterium]